MVCGARLGVVMASLCAQEGVAVVEGVDSERLHAICAACGVAPLRRWPPASALPQLLRRSAGFVAEGCQASSLLIGGLTVTLTLSLTLNLALTPSQP